MTAQEKKHFSNLWLAEFPLLYPISPSRLYRIVGPLVVGIELDFRAGADNYMIFVVMYGLWQDGIQSGMGFPIIFENLHDKEGVQMVLYERGHASMFPEACNDLRKGFGSLVEGTLALDDALSYCDNYIGGSRLSGSSTSFLVARVLQEKMCLCLAVSEMEKGKTIFKKAMEVNWNEKNFEAFKTRVSDWKTAMEMLLDNPESVRANVQLNRSDPKVKRLHVAELLSGR